MRTHHPFPTFEETAKCLDPSRLHAQSLVVLSLMRSFTEQYDYNAKKGEHGFSEHLVAKYWKGCELALCRYGLALCTEFLARADDNISATTFATRRENVNRWKQLIAELEDRDFPDDMPPFTGEPEFHSAFRSLLLFEDIRAATFSKWKRGEYPDHASTRNLLPRKSSWKRENYFKIWDFFGRPDPEWYGQFGWSEEADDMKFWITPDRVPYMARELKRKKDKPMAPFLMKKVKHDSP